ncbi:hypothetical protein KJ785_00030 [Patescibacteria group bacterium]|nr:hypothetical protein [Patescibacteria group bacterium]
MQNILIKLLETIKNGSPVEVKSAQKEVEKFWHNVYIPEREKGREAFKIFLEELKNFESIKDIDHQCYFINTLKWPLYAIGEEYFGKWADFFLNYIQHPSGKIRQAVIRAVDYLLMDIVEGLGPHDKKVVYDKHNKSMNYFCNFACILENLLAKYDEPRFKKFKYISSMPASVYKSLQILMTEIIFRSEYYEKLYEEFLKNISNEQDKRRIKINKKDLAVKRREIEQKMRAVIIYYELEDVLSFDELKRIVKTGQINKDNNPITLIGKKLLDNIDNMEEAQIVLNIIVEMWNHFPHDGLGGLSPREMGDKIYN